MRGEAVSAMPIWGLATVAKGAAEVAARIVGAVVEAAGIHCG
mgnify:CR=1 FL=1